MSWITDVAPKPPDLDEPPDPNASASDLLGALRRFEILQGQIQVLTDLANQLRGRRDWTNALEEQWESQCGKIIDEMAALSWRAEKCRAYSEEQRRAKAVMLSEWCVTQDDDLVHCLAASLSRDLCNPAPHLPDAIKPPKRQKETT